MNSTGKAIVSLDFSGDTLVLRGVRTPRDLERAAREQLGLSGREAKRLLAGGWSALMREDEPEEEPRNDDAAARAALQSLKDIFQ